MRRRLLVLAAVCALVPSLGVGAIAQASDLPCSEPTSPAGDWTMFGGDLASTRSQSQEHALGARVLPKWTFDANNASNVGFNEITGYPIVANGCVFVGSSTGNYADGQHRPGWVFAIDAATGDLVWKRQVLGGVFSTVAVDNHVVYAFVSVLGAPEVVALDQHTGEVLWRRVVDRRAGADAVSSPVVYDGVLWVGVSGTAAEGDEADRTGFQGSSVLLATDTSRGKQPGEILAQAFSIPQDQWKDGYAGGAQWGTVAIDETTGYGYVPTGNPFNLDREHQNTNAILKLDLRRGSESFGTFVGSYKGDVEEFFPQLADDPACEEVEEVNGVFVAGLECLNLDLDFGATPNIYTDETGRRVVAAGQKSGVVHFIDAVDMTGVGKTLVGVPSAVGGIVGSAAYDGENIYGPHTVGGYLWSMNGSTHGVNWLSPTGDGVHWGPPVTHANGVLWTVDLKGFLLAYDAATGLLRNTVPLNVGTAPDGLPTVADRPTLTWGGVTVARHAVFASVGVGLTSAGLPSMPNGYVVAFGPSPL